MEVLGNSVIRDPTRNCDPSVILETSVPSHNGDCPKTSVGSKSIHLLSDRLSPIILPNDLGLVRYSEYSDQWLPALRVTASKVTDGHLRLG